MFIAGPRDFPTVHYRAWNEVGASLLSRTFPSILDTSVIREEDGSTVGTSRTPTHGKLTNFSDRLSRIYNLHLRIASGA